MELNELKEIIKTLDTSGCSYLKLEQGDVSLVLKKDKCVEALNKSEKFAIEDEKNFVEAKSDEQIVKAPLVGIFYDSPSPDAKPYVKEGDAVKKGQILCLIEAMKMMNEVAAPVDGIIKKIYLNNQDIAEFGASLFAIGEENV